MSKVLEIKRKENERANDPQKSMKGPKIKENRKSKDQEKSKGSNKTKARARKEH